MADNQSSGKRRRRKTTSAQALREAYEILDKSSKKKKRKPGYYEFSHDPVTGVRNCKNTYSSVKYEQGKRSAQKKQAHTSSDYSEDVQDDNGASELPSCDTWKGELGSALSEAKEVLEKWSYGKPNLKKSSQSWGKRIDLSNESWETSRSTIIESLLKYKYAVSQTYCQVCKNAPAVIKCEDCGTDKHLCATCDVSVHQLQSLHDRLGVIDEHYKAIPPTVAFNTACDKLINIERPLPCGDIFCPDCNIICHPVTDREKTSNAIFVSLKGRFDVMHIMFECEDCKKKFSSSSLEVIVQLGYWPGSIKNINYIFDTNLFLLWHEIKSLVPGISESSFLKSLEQFSKHHGRIATINKTAFNVAFKEWKFCQYELNQLRMFNWMDCPACNEKQHSVHVDGNMKLYRFKSARTRKRDTYYNDVFIAPNEKVDEHINAVYKGSKGSIAQSEKDCKCGDTNWRAAGNTLQKKKNLVETGLEIAGCRHALAQKSVNMFHGEIYGYAHYMQVNYFIPKNIDFFWYDVVCKYWPWLEKHDKANHPKMKPALSVFHAKAHSWSCQSLWGGRWQEGACGTTGEEVELINSHFSRLGSTTKHMLPEGREELLTEHALEWNKRKIENLAHALSTRYKKTAKQLQNAKNEVDQKILELGVRFSSVDKLQWKKDVLDVAKESQDLLYRRNLKLTSDEETFLSYLLTLDPLPDKQKKLLLVAEKMHGARISKLTPESATNISSGETQLKNKGLLYCQKSVENSYHAITQMTLNMNKLADSSKQRKALRNKISKEKVKLKEMTELLNGISDEPLLHEDVENGCFYWQQMSGEASNQIPIRTRRLVVDKFMDVDRFEEELAQIQKEMLSYIKFYTNGVLTILRKQLMEFDAISNMTTKGEASGENSSIQSTNRYTTPSIDKGVLEGKKALTMAGVHFAMDQIKAGITAFAPILPLNWNALYELPVISQSEGGCDEAEDRDDDDDLDDDDEPDDDEGPDNAFDVEENDGEAQPAEDPVLNSVMHANRIACQVSDSPAPGVCCWRFPGACSQGSYKGRNGSNACSVIALLLGYIIRKKNVLIPSSSTQPIQLPDEMIDAVCGCIELGNDIYDMCRESLPSRYLSIEEAATVLQSWYPCALYDPLPVRKTDEHDMSTITAQLTGAVLSSGHESCSACFIINEKTSLYHISNNRIMYIDTHSHGSCGVIVLVSDINNLRNFIEQIWLLEGHSETMFGNLVFFSFH